MLLPYFSGDRLEAGCDEAGRGCLAGPVVAAAVILDYDHPISGLNDSKKLSPSKREALSKIIMEKAAAFALAEVSVPEIDEINILQASFRAMHLALSKLFVTPECLLIDGNRFVPYENIPHQCIIKGDEQYQSIAAASILAKTHRDELMRQAHHTYPHYNWVSNKGYPTIEHRSAIVHFGITPYHRKSFRLTPVGVQTKLEF